MPVYEYECEVGHGFEKYLPLVRYDEPQVCECGQDSKKVLGNCILGDLGTFDSFSDVSGQSFTTKHKWKEHLKRTDCVEMGRSDFAGLQKDRDKKMTNLHKDPKRKEKIIEEFNKRGL